MHLRENQFSQQPAIIESINESEKIINNCFNKIQMKSLILGQLRYKYIYVFQFSDKSQRLF